ncbi:prolyl-tRNA synthetase associated domain-containing protein, partial [Mesorhizobium sp. M4B.F.Ca.ET.190.01.1.1]|uniref:YbaK/EbsC family protein n=1 Tax=Mesorhizobium sp. M4B.F.Ca.ET.190.01.1.1 TaxID=2563951 RepID=UPI001136A003
TVRQPPLFTVADSQALRGEIHGGHTKNLFLKDKKDNYFLVTVGEEAVVDLKQIHHLIGAAGRVSFGKPEMLMELLGVIPGAVTVFGLINDTQGKVKAVLDQELIDRKSV